MRAILQAGGLGVVLTLLAIFGSWVYTNRFGPLFGHWNWAGMSVAVLVIVMMVVLGISMNAGGRPTTVGGGALVAYTELRGREAQGTGPGAMVADSDQVLIPWAVNILPPLAALVVLLVFF
jgi:hypothetical protein